MIPFKLSPDDFNNNFLHFFPSFRFKNILKARESSILDFTLLISIK